jgi:arylsulfatase A-like enzyme
MHGHDLTPLLRKPDSAWPHAVLTEYTEDKFGSDTERIPPRQQRTQRIVAKDHVLSGPAGVAWWVSLCQERLKYVPTVEEGEIEELYDLDKDPEELTNLALDPKNAELLSKFRQATLAELRRTRAKMVDRLPAVKMVGAPGGK